MAETKVFGIPINFGGKKKPNNPESDMPDLTDESFKNFTPATPTVNLLPPSVEEEYSVQNLKRKFLIIAGALIFVLGLGYAGTLFIQQQTEDNLRSLEQETVTLNSELASLSVYQNYVNSVDQKRQTLFEQFSGAIQYAGIAQQIGQAAQANGVSVSDFSFGTGDSGGTCSSPDPFNPSPAIGCITITASAEDVSSVVGFTESLSEQTGFVYPYFPTVTVNEGSVNMVGSVGYTAEVTEVPHPDMALSIMEQLSPSAAEDTQEQPPADDTAAEETEAGGEGQ